MRANLTRALLKSLVPNYRRGRRRHELDLATGHSFRLKHPDLPAAMHGARNGEYLASIKLQGSTGADRVDQYRRGDQGHDI